jgi:hypothetical protein
LGILAEEGEHAGVLRDLITKGVLTWHRHLWLMLISGKTGGAVGRESGDAATSAPRRRVMQMLVDRIIGLT